jgi:hemolysin activation/secretion protein
MWNLVEPGFWWHEDAANDRYRPSQDVRFHASTFAGTCLARGMLAAGLAIAGSVAWAVPSAQPAAETSFDLNEIRVDGDTVLPQEQVEEVVYPFLGPGKTAKDVEAARSALQAAYKDAGYVTVSVGPGRWVDHAGGVISLAVLERRVGRLRVTHARYFVPDAVREGAPSLAPGTVPNMKQVTQDLVGLNQLPDRTVQPSLRPGRRPDLVDVDLDVADTLPLHGTLELNNRNNADTSSLRLDASLTYDNFFQRGDSGTISYSVDPEAVRDSEIESASYLFHVPDSKLSLLFTYLHSNSNVVALGSTDVAGRGDTAGFRLLIPLGTTTDGGYSFTHSFSLGWDYKKFYELDTFDINQPSSGVPPVHAPVTYYPLSAAYAANWTGPKSTTDVNLSLELGINHIGSDTEQFDNKRYMAVPGFSVFRASVTREQDLPDDVQAWASISSQISNTPLVSSEQFGLGGADSVRGYYEAEALGDYGVSLQSELRSPDLKKYLQSRVGHALHSWRFHLFADTGVAGIRDATPGERTSSGFSSVGVGTRVNLWGYLNGAVQDAQLLNNGPDSRAGTNKVLFRVYGEF